MHEGNGALNYTEFVIRFEFNLVGLLGSYHWWQSSLLVVCVKLLWWSLKEKAPACGFHHYYHHRHRHHPHRRHRLISIFFLSRFIGLSSIAFDVLYTFFTTDLPSIVVHFFQYIISLSIRCPTNQFSLDGSTLKSKLNFRNSTRFFPHLKRSLIWASLIH